MCKHYNGFACEAQSPSRHGDNLASKKLLNPSLYYGPKAIAKEGRRAYTPCPHLPPLSIKVSQAEMEAGDCEGRLPPLFLSSGLWASVFGL
jgi:hypothetical protein